MKPNCNRQRLILIVTAICMLISTRCSTSNYAVEKYAKTLKTECSLELTYNDRIIIGYDQDIFNRKYYKVVDGEYFKPTPRVMEDSTLKPIGTVLIGKY